MSEQQPVQYPVGDNIWTLGEIALAIGARLVGADIAYQGVTTDSRGDCHGRLFIALQGERFDGHDYVASAAASGAAALLVDRPLYIDLPQLIVKDTRLALGRLAAAWRDRIPARLLAITGSNGKTTVKEMTAAILSQAGTTRATAGNLNNDIGMPLTLLAARDEDFLILEMGANHHGEIGYLTDIARPDVALITNAGRAHLEGFGSVEGVAHAKGEIARGLPPGGTFVVMADVPWTPLWEQLAAGRPLLTFGTGPSAQVRADENAVTQTWDEAGFRSHFTASIHGHELEIALPLAGSHNVRNALAAIAGCTALGLDPALIRAGLEQLVPVKRRLQPRHTRTGAKLLDDSYNANPDSLAAAVDVLTALPLASDGRHFLVLGDFGELGPDSIEVHQEMGVAARAAGASTLYAVGALSRHAVEGFGAGARHFDDQDALITALLAETGPDDILLVKGSRMSTMDRVADALCADARAH
ncbi:MAG: UDP-N-acetylmuramoyl-tripeptide--D-alanyl-D-alanine ligase [Lamprobacter sp.]|uniref:UDP-N-acetylmuramoyl-tripeptide--D-alanyl-D- alanine ligase n=1 Tax=Lamprobacter sp. TaxID=3100796 RepID=UPI002B259E2D|nr:UDP-N-acetylmuramoyl-tripeptide--D-alanyl-D-alanine ligase [Lamprobacter sp.]MEA3640205.1 UDP-N-acetylmuramoyl-tripeptide--D-alanyl-D-alanine ligase [Lamprobacter sp.]